MIKDRLDREMIGNVSIRVEPTEQPDAWEVQGRGEMQLAVLVELCAARASSSPSASRACSEREIDGKRNEPVEHVDDRRAGGYVGVITQLLGAAQGPPRADGQPRPGLGADGLPRAGARPDRLSHRVPDRDARHRPDAQRLRRLRTVVREIRTRPSGSLVADRSGKATGFAISSLQERGSLFISPGDELYEGMIVGETCARRGPRRQRRAREAPDEHALGDRATCSSGSYRRASSHSTRRSSSCATTRPSRSRPARSACARRCSTRSGAHAPRVTRARAEGAHAAGLLRSPFETRYAAGRRRFFPAMA